MARHANPTRLYAFNAGTMTGRSTTAALTDGCVLDVSPTDAADLGVVAGRPVRVRNRYGQVVLPCRISEAVAPGVVFSTFSDPAVVMNAVTGLGRDPYTHTPEYKVTAVRVEPDDTAKRRTAQQDSSGRRPE